MSFFSPPSQRKGRGREEERKRERERETFVSSRFALIDRGAKGKRKSREGQFDFCTLLVAFEPIRFEGECSDEQDHFPRWF